MGKKESLRYIGCYYNNGIIFKTKVYILNEKSDAFCLDIIKDDGDKLTEEIFLWQTKAIQKPSIVGYIILGWMVIVSAIVVLLLGILLFRFKEIFNGSLFHDYFNFEVFKSSSHTNYFEDRPPVFLTEKEMKKFFSRRCVDYVKKRFPNNHTLNGNGNLRLTSRLKYLGRLEGNLLKVEERLIQTLSKENV